MSKRLTPLLSVSLFLPTIVRRGTKSKTNVWWMAWRDSNGKLQRRSTRTSNRTAAKHIAAQLQEQLQLGRVGLIDGYAEHLAKPWSDFVKEFMQIKISRMPATSQMAYRMCLNAFSRAVQPKTLGDVNVQLLDEFVTKRLATPVSGATINKELRHLRAALRWAKFRRYLPEELDFSGLFLRLDLSQPAIIP